jgi:cell division protein FtsB
MLVFGVDIPLIEIILAFAIIIFILLAEALVIILLLTRQLNQTKKVTELVQKMSETILAVKKAEMEQLDRFRKK